jgi:hypothetical protein
MQQTPRAARYSGPILVRRDSRGMTRSLKSFREGQLVAVDSTAPSTASVAM